MSDAHPHGWRRALFSDLAELHRGYDLPVAQRTDGTVPVIGSNGVVGYHRDARLPGPGVITGRSGTIGLSFFTEGPYWPLNTALYVSDFKGNIPLYVHYFFRWFDFARHAAGVSVPTLNRNPVHNSWIAIPPTAEQATIAAVLQRLERAIQIQERQFERSSALKRAVMRDLFTRGLRREKLKETEIGTTPDSWAVVRFGVVREWLQYGTSERCSPEPAEYPVLRIPNVGAGSVNSDELKYCSMPPADADKYVLHHGDLLFIRTNGVLDRLGSCAVYEGTPRRALFASYLIRARLAPAVEPKYVAYFYGSERGTALVAGRATPAADGKYNLNTGTIDSLPLALPPSRDEQREIVAILDAIDRKIDIHRRKRFLLDAMFSSLLHRMMTGALRVSDLDRSAVSSLTEVSA